MRERRNGLFENDTCQVPVRVVLILAACWILGVLRDAEAFESRVVYVADVPGIIKDEDWNDRRDTVEQVDGKVDVHFAPGGIIAIASEPVARLGLRNVMFQCPDGLVDCRDARWGKVDESVANESGEAEMQVGLNKPRKQTLPLEVHHAGGRASNLPHMRDATNGADPARNVIHRECLDRREGPMCHRDDSTPREDGSFLILWSSSGRWCSGGRWTRQIVKRQVGGDGTSQTELPRKATAAHREPGIGTIRWRAIQVKKDEPGLRRQEHLGIFSSAERDRGTINTSKF